MDLRAGLRMRLFDPFRLDVANQCLWRGETRVSLMPKPFAVLRYLVEHPGRLVTHDQLLGAVWPDTFVQPEVLRRYILEIRRALGDRAEAPRFVQTFPKRGYQFIAPVIEDGEAVGTLAQTVSSPPATFVGRRSALADLDRCLEAAMSGWRQVVFIVGEAGIGKSSLVDAFQRNSTGAADVTVVRGQSVEGFGGKEAYYPLLEAVGQLARGPHRSLVVNALAINAPTWLIQFPSLVRPEQQAALQREILGATRERMVRELCDVLEIITQAVPLVLILEDLHWVDRSTLDAISAIARRREPAKLLVLGTCRPADLILSESPLKALKQDLLLHRLSDELNLERLQESDVADYVAAAFAPGDVPREFAAVIHRHSDGNPLFMTAMLDHLSQQGVLSQVDGRWRMTVPLDQIDPGVPETLKRMLETQLEHASDTEQQLLKCASVAGQRFTAWSVATMLVREPSSLEEMCEGLVQRSQFLNFSGTRELFNGASTAEYQFRHALYREVLYRRLTPTDRVTFHRRLASGLESLRSPVLPDMAAEIALHFEEGHEYEPAVRYLMLAAKNATRRYAHQQSVALLEHARELLAKVAADRGQTLDFQILERIGNAYYAMGDMTRSAETYKSMATRAAEAGLLAEQADALMRLSHPAESIPFFLRAVEIDPNFATAYTSLSRIYSNLGEGEPAKAYAKLAYELRDRASERDRLSITYQYHYEVSGDQSRASQTLEDWKHAFPLEFQPVNSLAVIHNFLGNFGQAIEEGQEAVRRDPSHGYPYSNLAHAYLGIGQFDVARQTAERAVALKIETLPTRRLLYQLALLAGDEQAATNHRDWARDRPREFEMIGARAQAAAWSGRLGEARQLYEDAARMAELRNLPDVGSAHLAWSTAMELAYGNTDRAVEQARRVLARNPSYDPQLRAALILAATGSAEEAEQIVQELTTTSPHHTLINAVLAPIVRAGEELSRNVPLRAIEQLQIVAAYELGFIAALAPLYLRGLSYLRLGAGLEAAEEFQRILDHRGSDPFSPFHAVAPLGLARAHAMAGNVTGCLNAYERFLTGWGEADPDVPVLLEARSEYDRLKRTMTSSARMSVRGD
jgi:DNA-binding winged helix-turn-helix (wHTH) protein/tetratricopeptide (TPR) repeat protein